MVPTNKDDHEFLDDDFIEDVQRRAYTRAEWKAIEREAKMAESARKANEEFKRSLQINQEAEQGLNAFHETVVEPAMLLMSNSLNLTNEQPTFEFLVSENYRSAISTVLLKRKVAYDIKFSISTTARVNLKKRLRVIVQINSEKIISKYFLRQFIAKLKMQTRILRTKKSGFSLSDLNYESSLSNLLPWFQEAMRNATEIHANLIAQEGQ